MGYPHGKKGYKVCDFHTKKTFIFRDIIFYEHLFPFHPSFNPSTSDCSLFPSYSYDDLLNINVSVLDSPIGAFPESSDSTSSEDHSKL